MQCLYASSSGDAVFVCLVVGGAVFVDASRFLVPIVRCSHSCDFSIGTVKSHVISDSFNVASVRSPFKHRKMHEWFLCTMCIRN